MYQHFQGSFMTDVMRSYYSKIRFFTLRCRNEIPDKTIPSHDLWLVLYLSMFLSSGYNEIRI